MHQASQNPAYRPAVSFFIQTVMKRVRCPRCDNYVTFDETKYGDGQTLVFVCDKCSRQFSIRLGKSRLTETQKESNRLHSTEDEGFGSVEVVENVFGYRQSFALHEGDNVIGRYNRGDTVDIPIQTTDRSMDRRHCVITVTRRPDGTLSHSLRDFPSLTGTFLFDRILGDRERASIEDGAVITLGATTLIFTFSPK